jgi:hypothetical protein
MPTKVGGVIRTLILSERFYEYLKIPPFKNIKK